MLRRHFFLILVTKIFCGFECFGFLGFGVGDWNVAVDGAVDISTGDHKAEGYRKKGRTLCFHVAGWSWTAMSFFRGKNSVLFV